MKPPQSILVIRFKAIGDVVLTLPAVSVVRQNFPKARITFLTSSENAPLLQGFRDVNEVLSLDRAALRSGNPLKVLPEFFGLLRRLRGGRFDLALDLQGYSETAWLARLSGAPERWGTIYSQGRKWAYTRSLPRNKEIHSAEDHLRLLSHGGLSAMEPANEFHLPTAALAAAHAFLEKNRLTATHPLLFLQPFTSSPHKNWPLENYLSIARHWQSRGIQIVFGGGPADRGLLETARRQGFVVSAGVPLLITAGLMRLSTLVLGGDTGALHLAVALGNRVLMLMHEVTPGSPIPFRHPDWVVVSPTAVAIHEIQASTVNESVARILTGPAGNVSC